MLRIVDQYMLLYASPKERNLEEKDYIKEQHLIKIMRISVVKYQCMANAMRIRMLRYEKGLKYSGNKIN
jgi:hypothetical protein